MTRRAHRRIFLALALLVSSCFLADAHSFDVLRLRFSEPTIVAMQTGQAVAAFPISGRLPQAKYDAARKKMLLEPVLAWLDERSQKGNPLSEAAFRDLTGLLLDPANHVTGLFAVGESPVMAVKFQVDGNTSYLVLSSSVVTVLWDGRDQGALLNEAGTKALAAWFASHGFSR